MPTPRRLAGLRPGPLLMIAAGLSFTIMMGFVKVARTELTAWDIIFWRGFASVPLAGLLALRSGSGWRAFSVGDVRTLALRITFGLGAMVGFFTSMKGLSLTDQALLSKLQPIVVALLAPLVIGRVERSGWTIWAVLVAGLFGSAILIAPELQVGSWWGVLALGATLSSGVAHVLVRRLTATTSPLAIVFWFQLAALVVAGSAVLISHGGAFPLPGWQWLPILLGSGLFAFLGQMLMTYGYQLDRASAVAAASYTQPVWAVLGDVLFLGLALSWTSMIGGLLVIGAGLFLVLSRDDRPRTEAAVAPGRCSS